MTAAWPDGTRVTVAVGNSDPEEGPLVEDGAQGETVDWQYAFGSDSRRYWVELDDRAGHPPVSFHETDLRREETSP